jgi:beta-glucan synthesis-associated protein KRE6
MSFWDKMHTFRLEWQPGPQGYVHWYIDGEYKFGIEADGLIKESSAIPNEPSYIILNTAISTTWGFPTTPKDCDTFDCKRDDGICGFSEGFCDMMPAFFKLDHVRVYQNKADPEMTVGCNPKEYPTKTFIKAHEYRYMKLTDKISLQPLVVGGEKCETDGHCGTGKCVSGECKCLEGWMGPRCLVPAYHNDFEDWDVDDWGELSPPFIPSFLRIGVAMFVVALTAVTFGVYRARTTVKYIQ